MAHKITKLQAERTLRAVETQWAAWIDDSSSHPILSMDWNGAPAILWEDGPSDWAYLFNSGGTEPEFGFKIDAAKVPAGVYAEPYYSFVLAIYPA